jgi:hypothetical protein
VTPTTRALLLIPLALCACNKAPEPTPTPALSSEPAPVSAPAAPASAAAAEQAGLTWPDPPKWTRVQPSNRMRKATYRVPRAAGEAEDAELAVFYFGPNDGGGIEANMKRWIDQFKDTDPKQVERSIRTGGGLKQHVIEIAQGTYSGGMPGSPSADKKDFALLGAIVETPSGSYFFKMTGPKRTVAGAKAEFFQMLDGATVGPAK